MGVEGGFSFGTNQEGMLTTTELLMAELGGGGGRQRSWVIGPRQAEKVRSDLHAVGQMNLIEQDVSIAQYKKHSSDLDVCRLDYV